MKTNQTTKTNRTATEMLKAIKTFDTPKATAQAPNKSTDTKQKTTDHLTELMNRRNDLIKALESSELVKPIFDNLVNDLCETIAQISVYKTLLKLSDSPKDITESGSKKCFEMYRSFSDDMRIYKHQDTESAYSDAFDLFQIAFVQVWEYLHTTAPLTLSDTVETKVLKNGTEKNYTIFQTACKSIREYINSWSKTDNYKKLHYIIGIADNGDIVASSKRPTDTLSDIDQATKTAFFTKYGLTAQQQEITALLMRGEKADTISKLLNIPLRTVQDNIKKAKAKFTTAQAYAEYITAKNAEKLAKAKAEKNESDPLYKDIYTKAQDRTAKAYTEWQTAYHKNNR